MRNSDTQVIIYFDSPKGQLMQVSYGSYKSYWHGIGWTILGEAPALPGFQTAYNPKLKIQPRMI